MDSVLKGFLESKKNLVVNTKIPATKKQDTKVVKPEKGMMDAPVEHDEYRRFASQVIKDLPSKKDLIEKIELFIEAEEKKL